MADIPDISIWQGANYQDSPEDSQIDYDKLAAMSPDGVILRASSGSYKDVRFEQNYAELRARGVPLAAYHFYKPIVSNATQAAVFLSAILDKSLDFPHFQRVLDVESPASGWSQSTYAAMVQNMLLQMNGDCIYTRSTVWNPYIGDPAWAKGYPLWIARYTDKPKPWGNPDDEPWMKPVAWDDYTLWQYSADGNGRGAEYGVKSSAIDLNRLNPAIVSPPEPEPEPTPEPGECAPLFVVRCISKVSKRDKANDTAKYLGDVYPGDVFEVLGVHKGDAPEEVWLEMDGFYSALSFKYWWGIKHFYEVV